MCSIISVRPWSYCKWQCLFTACSLHRWILSLARRSLLVDNIIILSKTAYYERKLLCTVQWCANKCITTGSGPLLPLPYLASHQIADPHDLQNSKKHITIGFHELVWAGFSISLLIQYLTLSRYTAQDFLICISVTSRTCYFLIFFQKDFPHYSCSWNTVL